MLDEPGSGLVPQCQCASGWTGPLCGNKECSRGLNGISCSGHGTCDATGMCKCAEAYTGPVCEFHDCSPSDANACSGHGTCDIGHCVCVDGFVDSSCSTRECPRAGAANNMCAGHGACINGVCSCDAGWESNSCSKRILSTPKATSVAVPSANVSSGNATAGRPMSTVSSADEVVELAKATETLDDAESKLVEDIVSGKPEEQIGPDMQSLVHDAAVVEQAEQSDSVDVQNQELLAVPESGALSTSTKAELERQVTSIKAEMEQLSQVGTSESISAEKTDRIRLLVSKLASVGAELEEKDQLFATNSPTTQQAEADSNQSSEETAKAQVDVENAEDALEIAQVSGEADAIKKATDALNSAKQRALSSSASSADLGSEPGFSNSSASSNNAATSCPSSCSGHGTCADHLCTCDDGFHGDDCSLEGCSDDCLHGTCRAGVCECDTDANTGWPLFFGDACDLRECPMSKINGSLMSCNGHGACISTGDKPTDAGCDCDDGYTGPACAVKTADVAESITSCNKQCVESCRSTSQGDVDLYMQCYNQCSRECTGVDATVEPEASSKASTQKSSSLSPSKLKEPLVPAALEAAEPGGDTENAKADPPSPAKVVHAAIDQAERDVLGDVPAESDSQNSIKSLRNVVTAHFDPKNAPPGDLMSSAEHCSECTDEIRSGLLEHKDDELGWVKSDCLNRGLDAAACEQLAAHEAHHQNGGLVHQYCALLGRC